MRIYAFKDDKIIHANSEDEAISIYKDIMKNRYTGETRSFEELDELATKYYDNNDQNSFYYFSDDELALLWSKCMFTNSHPWGQAYDDEIFDTIYSLPNKDEIFTKANEYADEEEKNFKGKPFFKSESLKENMTIEDMFKNVGVKIVFDDKGHFTKEAEEKYDEVAKKFFDGNQDKLDKLCDEEKCFDESLKEKVENSYSYKNYVIINDSKANCWRIKDSKDNWVENCFSTDKEAEEFIDSKDESLKEERSTKIRPKNKLLNERLIRGFAKIIDVDDKYVNSDSFLEKVGNIVNEELLKIKNFKIIHHIKAFDDGVDSHIACKFDGEIQYDGGNEWEHFNFSNEDNMFQQAWWEEEDGEYVPTSDWGTIWFRDTSSEIIDAYLAEDGDNIFDIINPVEEALQDFVPTPDEKNNYVEESLKEGKGHPKFDAKMWSDEEQEKIQKDVDERNHKATMNKIKKSSKKQLKENSTDIVYFKEMPDDHYVDVDFIFEDFEESYPGFVITGNDRLKDFGVEQFKEIFEEYDKDEDIISALEEKTGKKYDVALMRGYYQSDWQGVYYPVEDKKYLDGLEAYYFGKVKEYIDEEEGTSYLVLDDIVWKGTDALKQELSNQSGIPVENIKIRKFNGYTRTANYVDEKLNEKSLKEDIETPYFKAYITNLGKYNEGELVGEWVEFPIDEDDFNEVLKKIGVSDEPDADGNYYEEFFVTDYDCNLNGFNWQDFGEYPSYDTLQEFGELIESIDDVEAVDNAYEVTGDLKEAIDGLEDGSIIYYPGIHSDSDLGYEIINQIYSDGIPKDTLDSYFDYEALGRDLSFDEYENSEYDDFDMEEATKEYIDKNGYDEIKELDKFIDFKEMGEYLYDGDEDLTDEQYIEWAKNYVKENGYDDAEDYIDFESLGEWLKDNSLIDVPEQYISAGEYWCGDEYASDSDIGYAYVEAAGPDGVDNPENYFDYESFGRDLTFGNFTLTSDGAIEYN